MFEFLHKKHIKEGVSLVIVIGSDKVSSAIVLFKTDKPPQILLEHTKHFYIHNDRGTSSLVLTHVKEVCAEILIYTEKIKQMVDLANMHVHVFLHPSFHEEEILEKTIKKETAFILSQKILDEEGGFVLQERQSAVVLEKKIISIKANGYFIEHPLGRKVNSVDLKGFVTYSENRFIEDLRDEIHLSFPNQPISFHTTTLAFSTMSALYLTVQDYILVLPEATYSTLIYIKNSVIENIIKVPYGKLSLIRDVARELSTHLNEASSLISLWFEDKIDAKKREVLETVIKNSKECWHMLLKGAFVKLSKATLLPTSIFFADNSIESHILGSWVTSEDYSNQVLTIDSFQVAFFTHEDLISHVELKGNMQSQKINTEILSAILFCNIT